ncbi:SDR family NAD(P)-dependent oxidoreductase [Nocardia amikacinitolerans]|uniref:SDR family NAD(P)-dependent oxidoreductase n=1 Tax=Nocardia amikacinitolerans TaxID=756689 RepID=UPI0020A39E9F|nr:SDR family NAD(P)-dependent oxidoreductase [Nocardia amikacinitolerans]MCP2290596.1 Short-chain dehydrogenase [Nocardia amikacinitolerans]
MLEFRPAPARFVERKLRASAPRAGQSGGRRRGADPGADRPGADRHEPDRPSADQPRANRPSADRSRANRTGADRAGANHQGADQSADSLAGKRVLLTDACSEVGRATAALLADRGAQLLLVARRGDQLITTCEQITSAGGRAHWFRCDISALGDVDQLVTWVLAEFGSVDVLVNNAGRPLHRPVAESLDRFRDYQRMMAVNYFGPLRLTLGLLPAMLNSGSGHVVNVGPAHHNAAAAASFASYASSQAAWTTFAECAEAELGSRGIQVTAIDYPAVHADPAAAGTEQAFADEYDRDPAEVARAVEAAITARDEEHSRLARTLRGLVGVAPRSTTRLRHAFGL